MSGKSAVDTHGANGVPWVGFDLDGTLAEYDGWHGIDHIGAPITPMVELVKRLHGGGTRVKIMTARVSPRSTESNEAVKDEQFIWMPCPNKGENKKDASEWYKKYAHEFIEEWCEKHLGFVPEIVHEKDFLMISLYDDRVRQVIPNRGVVMEDVVMRQTSAIRNICKVLTEIVDEMDANSDGYYGVSHNSPISDAQRLLLARIKRALSMEWDEIRRAANEAEDNSLDKGMRSRDDT